MLNFWNGNKSPARQAYELALLQTILDTQPLPITKINNDITDYPSAEDEGDVFNRNTDVLVTVAGNKKFADKAAIKLTQPLCRGLLGYCILIVREQQQYKFKNLSEKTLKGLIAGIPATWADADLFRANQYNVLEQGSLADILQLLKEGKCDYVSLGANEVQTLFSEFAQPLNGLIIEESIVLHYAFPLVFYIHPKQQQLAKQIEQGFIDANNAGNIDKLFEQHYGQVVNQLQLTKRRTFKLNNPALPLQLS